jgi:hypothetical protein
LATSAGERSAIWNSAVSKKTLFGAELSLIVGVSLPPPQVVPPSNDTSNMIRETPGVAVSSQTT